MNKKFRVDDDIIKKSRPGDKYILKYKVGHGGSYALNVKSFELEILKSEKQDKIGRLLWAISHFDKGKNTCIISSCTKYLEIKEGKLLFHNGNDHIIEGGKSGTKIDDNKDHIVALRYVEYKSHISDKER